MATFVVTLVRASAEDATMRIEAERFVTEEGFVTFYDASGRDVRRFSADIVYSVRRLRASTD